MKSSGPFRCLWPTLAAGCTTAYGQSVLAPVLVPPPDQTSAAATSETLVGSVGAPVLLRPSEAEAYPLRWGPARFHPNLGYQLSHGDGFLQGTNASEKTFVQIITPGFYADIGRYWSFDLAVPFSEYSNPLFEDNVGYQLALAGRIPQDQWTFNFGYASSLTEDIQRETSAQDTQNSHVLSASAIRQLPKRLSLEMGVSQDIRLSELHSDYWTWTSVNWFNYQATPKTAVGLGVGGGYNFVDPGVSWYFEHLKARLVWQPGSKLNVQVNGGGQFVQFQDAESTKELFPVAGASVLYRIRTGTSLTVAASHSIENALEPGEHVEQSSATVGLRQRFLEQFYLDVVPGYNLRTYKASTGLVRREDEYVSIQVQLSTVLFKKLNTAVFYQFSDNKATEDDFTFQSNQVGLRLTYRY
jgi:hypothetical protein